MCTFVGKLISRDMIQTQLLKADQPYQIICAAGQVGIQVATLIVTEDKMTAEGYQVDTHSHPVVNYANKDGLLEDLKYFSSNPDEEYRYYNRMQPEGAVWNKVEVRDVRVLGLAGAKNIPISLDFFVILVPSISSEDPSVGVGCTPLWGIRTSSKITNLIWALERVGVPCSTWPQYLSESDRDGYTNIYLEIDSLASVEHLVKVELREEFNPLTPEIAFRCRLDKKEPMDCMTTIVRCVRELDQQFIRSKKLRFVYRQSSSTKDEWEDLLERCTEHINEMWQHRYGLG